MKIICEDRNAGLISTVPGNGYCRSFRHDRLVIFNSRHFNLRAFTLIEVMIAVAIFFAATFAILAVVSQCLRAAQSLTRSGPTAGMVAAWLSQTNKLEEGSESGDFADISGGLYPDYEWMSDTVFYASNGLYRLDIAILHNGSVDSQASILLFRPESTTGLSTRSQFR